MKSPLDRGSIRGSRKRKVYKKVVVAGGGPTGVELAGALGEISRFTLGSDFHHADPRRHLSFIFRIARIKSRSRSRKFRSSSLDFKPMISKIKIVLISLMSTKDIWQRSAEKKQVPKSVNSNFLAFLHGQHGRTSFAYMLSPVASVYLTFKRSGRSDAVFEFACGSA